MGSQRAFFRCTETALILITAGLMFLSRGFCSETSMQWEILENGLEYAEFKTGMFHTPGDSVISVLKIDTASFALTYIGAVEFDSISRTPRQWAEKMNLAAAINAGMYQKDFLTHVGYLKNKGTVFSRVKPSGYKSVLVFNPKHPDMPRVELKDLDCSPFKTFESQYLTVIQNIRMISCRGTNVWSRQKDRHSLAALGQDSSGNILFLFSRSPYTVHDFIEIIRNAGLAISRAMYLEGGGPAGMYIKSRGREIIKQGVPSGTEHLFTGIGSRLPNVIGVVGK